MRKNLHRYRLRGRHFRINRDKARHSFNWMHTLAHMGYFAAVYIEGHGWYSGMAGSLLIFTIANLFVNGSEGGGE